MTARKKTQKFDLAGNRTHDFIYFGGERAAHRYPMTQVSATRRHGTERPPPDAPFLHLTNFYRHTRHLPPSPCPMQCNTRYNPVDDRPRVASLKFVLNLAQPLSASLLHATQDTVVAHALPPRTILLNRSPLPQPLSAVYCSLQGSKFHCLQSTSSKIHKKTTRHLVYLTATRGRDVPSTSIVLVVQHSTFYA